MAGEMLFYFLAVGVSKGMFFFLIPIITRHVSPYEYGIAVLATNFISIASIVIMFGLPSTVLSKFPHIGSMKNQNVYLNQINNVFFRIYTLFLVIYCAFLPFFDFSSRNISSKNAFLLIIIVAVTIPSHFFYQESVNVLRMRGRISFLSIIQIGVSLVSAGVGLALLLKTSLTYGAILFMQLLNVFPYFFITLFCFKGVLRVRKVLKKDLAIFKMSSAFLLQSLLHVLIFSISPWMLGFLVGVNEVGIYGLAIKIATLYDLLIAQTVNLVLMPWLFKKMKLQYKLYFNWMRLVAFGFFIMGGGLLLSPSFFDPLIHFFLGEKYQASVPFIKNLIAAYLFLHGLSLLNMLVIYSKKVHLLPLFSGFSLVLNLVLNFLWLPTYGVQGAVYSIAVTFIVVFLFQITVISFKIPNQPKGS